MNPHAEQSTSWNDHPESVAADIYGKDPVLTALKRWNNEYSDLLERISEQMSDPTKLGIFSDEVACAKDGLRIMSDRAWSINEIGKAHACWNLDEIMLKTSDLLEKLRGLDDGIKPNQIIDDLSRILWKGLRFRPANPHSYRALYMISASVLAGIALALGIHFIPEKQKISNGEEIKLIEIDVPEVEEPEDETGNTSTINPFPRKNTSSKKKPGDKPKVVAVEEKKPSQKKPGAPNKKDTSREDKPSKAEEEALAKVIEKVTKSGPVMPASSWGNVELNVATSPLYGNSSGDFGYRGNGGTGGKGGNGQGGSGNGEGRITGLGAIDTGGGTGRNMNPGLDTTLNAHVLGNPLDKMSEGDKLIYVRNFLARNGMPMKHNLFIVIQRIIENRDRALWNLGEARDNLENLEDRMEGKDSGEWRYIKTYIRTKKNLIVRLASEPAKVDSEDD